jgi:four helix bundle protein
MKTFRTLDLAIGFSKLAGQLKYKDHLKEQLERAESSIALNLSEGNAKGSAREKPNIFHMAYGSLRECQTIFKLMNLDDKKLLDHADALGACLYKLVNSELKNSPNWKKGHQVQL